VAARLALPEDRVRRMLKAYSKATPLAADDTPVEVLEEDAAVLALNKPPRLRSTPRHRFEGNSLLGRAIGHLQRAAGVSQLPEESMPRVVHRLDMDTSGVVVFGKTREATSGLTRQFAAREASKTYLALVAGVPEAPKFEVDAAIARDAAHEVGMRVVDSSEDGGKPSRTLVRVLASRPGASVGGSPRLGDSEPLLWKRTLGEGMWPQGVSLVEATPLTGRTHQIRLHLSHSGFPILGDTVYGVFGGKGACEGEGLWGVLRRQALHARSLKVVHPATGSSVRFSAALPTDMLQAAEHLGLEVPGDVRSSGAERVAEGDDKGGSDEST
jgi:23S rRNA pseudouridine1911/1915/1917 synthase